MAQRVQDFDKSFTALKERAGPNWSRQFEAAIAAGAAHRQPGTHKKPGGGIYLAAPLSQK